MKIENSFEVPAPPKAAWDLLMDVPRVIPCMPGAELVETVDENMWKATVAVKLGPIALNFAADVVRQTVDEANSTVTLNTKARETRGRGGAQAAIQSTLSEVPGGTKVDIVTDVTMSGAVAQYGRGIVQDVAGQLTAKFADCLKAQLAPAPAGEGEPAQSPPPSASPAAAKPISGLSLGIRALGRMITRFFGRLAGRKPRGD